MTWADKLLCGLLLLLSAGGIAVSFYLFPATGTQLAEISVDGTVVRTVTLRPGYHEEFRIGGSEHYDVIEIDGSRVRVKEADCPDQICVKTGWIRTAPQQIVCLPWRVVVRVKAVASTDIDDIAR
jgi:hypothetical protein